MITNCFDELGRDAQRALHRMVAVSERREQLLRTRVLHRRQFAEVHATRI